MRHVSPFRHLVVGAFLLTLAACGDDTKSDAPTAPEQAPQSVGVIAEAAAWGSGGKTNIDPNAILTDNWYIVLDGSGSMSSSECSSGKSNGRIEDAKDAVRRFVQRLPATSNIGLYVFDDNAWGERVPLGRGTTNRQALLNAISKVVAGGFTPLGPSLDAGFKSLKAQAARQGGYGNYHLVVETDGDPDSFSAMSDAVDRIVQSPVILETIGFCIASGHPLNRPGHTVYHNAMNPKELDSGLEAILAETDAYSDKAKGGAP